MREWLCSEARGPSRKARGLFIWQVETCRTIRGFTAIELVAALAVTALMGALAVSAYRTHAVRAQISASVALAAAVQRHVAMAFERDGAPPANGEAAGMPADRPPMGPFLDSIEVVDGRIDLRFGKDADPAIAGAGLSLTPFETADGEVVWLCGRREPSVGLRPLGFAAGTEQPTGMATTVDDRYLPSTCR